jgi:DNA-binding NarL/FixJ family response regulator
VTGIQQKAVRLLIVDDHPLMAQALVAFFAPFDDISVIGVADSVSAGIEASAAEGPDVVLMDFCLPGGTGADAARAIAEQPAAPAVVFLSAEDSADALLEAVNAGACAYLLKTDIGPGILEAVRGAARGEMMIPAITLGRLLTAQREMTRRDEQRRLLGADLTPREREVLALMVEGLDNSAIADRLTIRVTTARTHVQGILEKLGVHSKLAAVSMALSHGIVEIQPAG